MSLQECLDSFFEPLFEQHFQIHVDQHRGFPAEHGHTALVGGKNFAGLVERKDGAAVAREGRIDATQWGGLRLACGNSRVRRRRRRRGRRSHGDRLRVPGRNGGWFQNVRSLWRAARRRTVRCRRLTGRTISLGQSDCLQCALKQRGRRAKRWSGGEGGGESFGGSWRGRGWWRRSRRYRHGHSRFNYRRGYRRFNFQWWFRGHLGLDIGLWLRLGWVFDGARV